MEQILSRHQNKINNIILSGLGSGLTVVIIYLIYRDVTQQTISVLSILQNLLNIYFLYQVLDITTASWINQDMTKKFLYGIEFLKLLVAMSITATLQYYLISRPILNQDLKPNYFYVTILLALPAAVISRILYELKIKKTREVEDPHEKNYSRLLHNPAMQSQINYIILLVSGFAGGGILLLIHLAARILMIQTINLLTALFFIICIYFVYQLLDLMDKQWGIRTKNNTLRFGLEFIKLFFAFFVATNAQFYLIARPILYQNYDINYLFVTLSVSIPAAVIARLIFEMRQAKEIALQSRLAQAEAQYNLLETQMQPHFLFNSLNVLSELIYVDPDLACSVTQQLADLYREILSNSKSNFSNLGSEISILKKYIQIQKIRFGERIRFKSEIGAEYFDVAVPSLILQTLVENAIKHGISPRQEGGEIELTINSIDNMYELTVANTGEVFKGDTTSIMARAPHRGQGTGLQNTKNRLELFYGRSHSFRIHSDEKKTYVSFRVPKEGINHE
jgi:two-component system, LytTR family, sensor kinase